jgi:hypothetical protein
VSDYLDRTRDVGLAVLAVTVLSAAGYALTHDSLARDPLGHDALAQGRLASAQRPASSGTATGVPVETGGQSQSQDVTAPSDTPALYDASRVIVLIGPDAAALKDPMQATTGGRVQALESLTPSTPGAASTTGTPGTAGTPAAATPELVVLEIEAGSLTTKRTRTAIDTARHNWPTAQVYVVGPFGPDDRKSAAAAKSASAAANARFLDPVALGWRPDATSAILSDADLSEVAVKLGEQLAP